MADLSNQDASTDKSMADFICQSRLAREREINQTSYENNLSNVLLKKQGLRSQIAEIEYLLRLLNQ
jgi:hypothetical protein